MASFVKILLHVTDSKETMNQVLSLSSTGYSGFALEKLISDMVDGTLASYTKVSTGAIQATGTGTFTGAATANQTMTIGGVTFTAKASPNEAANEYLVSATVALEAASLVRAVNANTTLARLVLASSALGVVTFTAVQPGVASNFFPTVNVNTSNFSFAQAILAGGTDGTQVATNYGRSS